METKEYSLTDICDFQGGTQPPKEEWITEPREGYVRMLQIRDFTQDKAEHVGYVKDTKKLNKCKVDDILIGRYGASVGKILTGLAGAYNVAIIKIIPNEELLSKRYLYYVLTGTTFQNFILNIGARAAQAGFNKSDLSLFKLHIPTSLEDQERIADVLEKTKGLIEKRDKSLDFIDEFLKMKFLEMFIINKSFEDWGGLFKIKNLVEKNKHSIKAGPFGSSLKKEFYAEKGYKIYGQEQVIADDFTIGDYYIDEKLYEKLKTCKIKTGDILISLVGTYGKVSIVPDIFEPGIINPRLMKISFNQELIHPLYFKYLLRSEYLQIQISKQSRGGTMDIINVGIVKELEIPKPPLPLQAKFVSIVHQVEKVKTTLEASKDELVGLSNCLSQKALKGELEIIEKIFIAGTLKIQPKITGEVIAIDEINKELEIFHKSQPHTGAPDEIDNTIRQLEAELKIKGEIPFWDEYVKYRIVKSKFKVPFTFEQLWEEITKFPFETLPSYDKMSDILFKWLKEENPFIKQIYNENTKQIELLVNETAKA